MWGLGIKNAFLQASGFCREVFLRAPVKWGPKSGPRTRKLQSPADGLNGAPVAIDNTLKTVFVAARKLPVSRELEVPGIVGWALL